MSITPNDIAAQRAMIERGEAIKEAKKQHAERERLRDTFAAAALTGLLSNIPRYQLGVIAVQAYDIADEMLRERGNYSAKPNSSKAMRDAEDFVRIREQFEAWQKEQSVGVAEMDSVADRKSVATPGACARSCSQPFDSAPTTDDAATGEPGGGVGFSPGSRTGPITRTPERESPRRECGESSLRDVPQLDNSRAAGGPEPSIFIDGVDRPVSYAKSDEKRVFSDTKHDKISATTKNDRGFVTPAKTDTTQPRNGALGHQPCQDFVQKNLTLTREEREAIDFAADFLDGRAVAATLRSLLERLGGGE